MNTAQETPGVSSFEFLREQIADLHSGAPRKIVAGHLDLGPDLWLSTDPAGRAAMECRPIDEGFALELADGDSGSWCSLGMRLPVAQMETALYIGVLVDLGCETVVSYTPTLRYRLHDGGFLDVPAQGPAVLAGGRREVLSYIPLSRERLADAAACELNLFFHDNAFAAEIFRFEPVLIL